MTGSAEPSGVYHFRDLTDLNDESLEAEARAAAAEAEAIAAERASLAALDVPPRPDERALGKLVALRDGHRHRVLAEHERAILAALEHAEDGHLCLGWSSGPDLIGVDETAAFLAAVDGLVDVGLVDVWEVRPRDPRVERVEYRLLILRRRTPRPAAS